MELENYEYDSPDSISVAPNMGYQQEDNFLEYLTNKSNTAVFDNLEDNTSTFSHFF